MLRRVALSLRGPGQSPVLPFACCVRWLFLYGALDSHPFFPSHVASGGCFFTGPWTVTRSSLRMLRRVAVSLQGPGQSPVLPFACCIGSLFLYGALDSHPFFPSHVALGRCFFTGPWTVTRSSLRMLRQVAVSLQGPGQSPVLPFACCVGWLFLYRALDSHPFFPSHVASGGCFFTGPWTVTRSSLRMLRRVAVSLRGTGQSPVLPFACCVGSLFLYRALDSHPFFPSHVASGGCFFTEPWTVTRSSLRMLRRVAVSLRGPGQSPVLPFACCVGWLFLYRALDSHPFFPSHVASGGCFLTGPWTVTRSSLRMLRRVAVSLQGPGQSPVLPFACCVGWLFLYRALDSHPFFPSHVASGGCFFTGPWTVTRSSLRMLRRVAVSLRGPGQSPVLPFACCVGWLFLYRALDSHPFFPSHVASGGCFFTGPWTVTRSSLRMLRRVAVSLRGPGQSPVLPFACCVGWLFLYGALDSHPFFPSHVASGGCFFTGPWTVTRSSLRMLRRVAVSLQGPGQSPVLPFACCVGSLFLYRALDSHPFFPSHVASGGCFFTGPWTVTRSSLRMLHRVAVSLQGPGQSPVLPFACCVGWLFLYGALDTVTRSSLRMLRRVAVSLRGPGQSPVLPFACCVGWLFLYRALDSHPFFPSHVASGGCFFTGPWTVTRSSLRMLRRVAVSLQGPGQSPVLPFACCVGWLFLYRALDSHPFFPSHVASGGCFFTGPWTVTRSSLRMLRRVAVSLRGPGQSPVLPFACCVGWLFLYRALDSHPFFPSHVASGGCFFTGPWTVTRSSLRMLRRVAVSLRSPGQSPVLPFACCVGWLFLYGALDSHPFFPSHVASGGCFFTGPWTVTRSSLRMLRRVAVSLQGPGQSPVLPFACCVGALFLYRALDSHPFFPSHVASGRCFFTGPWTVTRSSLRMLRRVAVSLRGPGQSPVLPFACCVGWLFLYGALDSHPFFPSHVASGRSFFTGPWTVTRSSLRMLRRVAVSLRGPGQSPVLPFACCIGSLFLYRALDSHPFFPSHVASGGCFFTGPWTVTRSSLRMLRRVAVSLRGPGQSPVLPFACCVGWLFLYRALDSHPFFPSHVASGRCFFTGPWTVTRSSLRMLRRVAVSLQGPGQSPVLPFACCVRWLFLYGALDSHPFFPSHVASGGCFFTGPWTVTRSSLRMLHRVAVSLRGPGQSPVLPFACCVGWLFLYGALDSHPFFPSHVASGRCFFTGPWTVTRSSLRMLRRVAVSLRGPGQSPVLPFACCVGWLFLYGALDSHPFFPSHVASGGCFFTGPWTVTRSSLRMLRRVAVSLRGPGQSPVLPFACCIGSLFLYGALDSHPFFPSHVVGAVSLRGPGQSPVLPFACCVGWLFLYGALDSHPFFPSHVASGRDTRNYALGPQTMVVRALFHSGALGRLSSLVAPAQGRPCPRHGPKCQDARGNDGSSSRWVDGACQDSGWAACCASGLSYVAALVLRLFC